MAMTARHAIDRAWAEVTKDKHPGIVSEPPGDWDMVIGVGSPMDSFDFLKFWILLEKHFGVESLDSVAARKAGAFSTFKALELWLEVNYHV